MKVLWAGAGALGVMMLFHQPATAQEPSNAREQFQTSCAACHGPEGRGMRGPSLEDVIERLGRDGVEDVIREGREDAGMPAWGDVLTDTEIDDLVDFVETLPEGAAARAGSELPILLSGLEMPTAMAFTEEGGLYIAEKRGTVRFSPSLGAPAEVVASLVGRTYDYGELGLTGIVVYDDHVYIAFTTGMTAEECGPFEDNYDSTCVSYGEVARFPIGDGGRLGELETVIGGEDDPRFCTQFSAHGIAGLYVRANGELLVAAGDGASFFDGDIGQHDGDPCGGNGAFRVQNPGEDSAMGTISILNADGSLATLAKGMRNPFGLTEMDGVLYSANTGWDYFEEIDRVEPGHNSGWPCYEGLERVNSYPTAACEDVEWVEPLFKYPNADPSAAISALAAHDGRLYFGDYVQQWIKSIDPAGGLGQEPELVTRGLMPVSLQSYGGDLFALDIYGGNVVVVQGTVPGIPAAPEESVEEIVAVQWQLPLAAGVLVTLVAVWAVVGPARKARGTRRRPSVAEGGATGGTRVRHPSARRRTPTR
jgi:glucose/arabinose dehydrogenase